MLMTAVYHFHFSTFIFFSLVIILVILVFLKLGRLFILFRCVNNSFLPKVLELVLDDDNDKVPSALFKH